MKDNKRRKNDTDKEEQARQERKIERVSVFVPKEHTNLKSTMDFEWPEFSKENERIKNNNKRFAGMSITEAFNKVYGNTIKPTKEEPMLPVMLRIGQLIDVNVSSVTDKGVNFTNLPTKETVVCKNNLSKYKNLSNDIYKQTIKAKVVDINKRQVTVDILQPLFDEWINDIMTDPTNQYDIDYPQLVTVQDLQISNSGFVGKAIVPNISKLLGEPYYVDAFIPGSHIVLNIEQNFEKWNGQRVETFVSNYINKPNSLTQKSLVCSRKNFLTFQGDLVKIELYKHWCSDDEVWKDTTKTTYPGKVTGIINSSKKCGVFVEIPTLNITGMVSLTPEEIVKYKPNQEVFVQIVDFEDMTYFDEASKQRIHMVPYQIEDNKLRKCILKPVLKFA